MFESWQLQNLERAHTLLEVSQIFGYFKISTSTSSLSMYNSSGYSFKVEVSELFNKMDVLKQNWSIIADSEGVLVVETGVP